MMEWLQQPWPWYVAGPLIGLMIPLLLLTGNKKFGVSSSLRHICAMTVPGKIEFFRYDWKKEKWNLLFVLGLVIGGCIGATFMFNPEPVAVHPTLTESLAMYGITPGTDLIPIEVINFTALFTLKGFLMIAIGGFMVGFGTRYAGGCTSGHSIMGLASLQWPSLVATCCFMAGGMLMANFILPLILQL